MFDLKSRVVLLNSLSQTFGEFQFWGFFLLMLIVWVFAIPFLNLKVSIFRYNLFEKSLKKKHLEDRMEEARHRRVYLDIENGNKTLEEMQDLIQGKDLEIEALAKKVDDLTISMNNMVSSDLYNSKTTEGQAALSIFQNRCSFLVSLLRNMDYKGYYSTILMNLNSSTKPPDSSELPTGLIIANLEREEVEEVIKSRDIEGMLEGSILLKFGTKRDIIDSIKEPLYSTLSSIYPLNRGSVELLVDELPRLKYQDRIRHIERMVPHDT